MPVGTRSTLTAAEAFGTRVIAARSNINGNANTAPVAASKLNRVTDGRIATAIVLMELNNESKVTPVKLSEYTTTLDTLYR